MMQITEIKCLSSGAWGLVEDQGLGSFPPTGFPRYALKRVTTALGIKFSRPKEAASVSYHKPITALLYCDNCRLSNLDSRLYLSPLAQQ